MSQEEKMTKEEIDEHIKYWSYEEQCKREPEKKKYLTAVGLIAGLNEGLSRYLRRTCRTAVIFANQSLKWEEFIVCDPSKLLNGHQQPIKEFFEQPDSVKKVLEEILFGYPRTGPNLPGLFTCVIQDTNTGFQLWFVELPSTAYSTAPLEGWFLRASSFMDFDPPTINQSLHYGVAATMLVSTLASDAIATGLALKSEPKNPNDYQRFSDIVSVLSNVSQTVEEGSLPIGNIIFSDGNDSSIRRIDFKPVAPLTRHKHVGKLLASVANSQNHALLANLSEVTALAHYDQLPAGSFLAKFARGEGELIAADKSKICSFYGGEFYGADPPSFEDVLDESALFRALGKDLRSALTKRILDIVHHAQVSHHGCSIVLDFEECPPQLIAGHLLSEPLSLDIDQSTDRDYWQMMINSSAIDGALYLQITRSAVLMRGFGCILAGDATEAEDRSRGSRHNSAIRFTGSYKKALVIVVSEDGPVSVFAEGARLQAKSLPDSEAEEESAEQKSKILTVADWLMKRDPDAGDSSNE